MINYIFKESKIFWTIESDKINGNNGNIYVFKLLDGIIRLCFQIIVK